MRRTAWDGVLVACLAMIVFFTGLGTPRLWDRDETRNAGCAVEMLQAGDWVTPMFNGELRTHKPALTYWFMMLSYGVLGISEFSARLPSALFGIGTCLLTWFIGRRLFGRGAGFWSGIALASALMFGVASRAATPDAPLVFFSTLSLAIFVAFTTTSQTRGFIRLYPARRWQLAVMYGVMGLAVLAKGPIGLVLPTAVIGMFLLIQRLPARATPATTGTDHLLQLVRPFAPKHFLKACWAMKPLTALAAAGAVALPWYVWVHWRTEGAWTYGFFVTHNVGRAMNSMEGHQGNVLFYPVALLAGFFPWSIFWLPAALDASKRMRERGAASAPSVFAACWVGVYLGLFSLAKTKLPSYITPCHPGFAILIGVYLDRWTSGAVTLAPVWRRMAYGSLIAVGAGICVALPVLSKTFLPGEEMLGLVGLIPLIGGGIALWLAEGERPRLSGRMMTGTAVAFCTALFSIVAIRIDQHRHIEDMVAAVSGSQAIRDVKVGSVTSTESSWVFYCRQPIVPLATPADVEAFFANTHDGQRRVILATDNQMSQLDTQFPVDQYDRTFVPLFLEKEKMIVLTPRTRVMQAAAESPEQN